MIATLDQTPADARFAALLEQAADIAAIVSADGTVLRVSGSVELVLGYTPAELIGRRGFGFAAPEDEPALQKFLADAGAATGATAGPPFRARDSTGNWHALEPMALNLLDDGAVGGVVITCRDVTARRDLEARVRQMERLEAVGQLAGGIAHDFNNVLLVIRGYSSVLRSALGDSELAPDVDEIVKAADRAAELTRQLLAFACRQILKPAVVDLGAIVLDLESLLRRSVREDIELRLEVPGGELDPVLADPSQIEQVLLNLVVNARDAMPGGGGIVISLAPAVLEPDAPLSPPVEPGRYVALTVADTGFGIPPDVLPFIFEPFFTTKDEGVGTGLGLSTVYGIVAQSGGGIEVAARPGGGTRITVYLPAADGVRVNEDALPQSSRPLLGNETILLVEDEDAVRDLVGRVLELAGYRVLAAARPSEAQRVAVDERIDLLLTDIVMPEMSGYDLANRIRLAQPAARILFISGYAHAALAETDELPEGELLRKPFSPDQLTRAVRALLDGEKVEPA